MSVERRAMDDPPARSESAADRSFLRLEGVSKRFGDVTALNAVSLDVARGEILTLLGPSGGGKTTMLYLLAGFIEPDTGTIEIDHRIVNNVPPYRRDIGILFQNYALFPHMNVAANVGYGLKLRRLSRSQIRRRLDEVLALVHLTGYEQRKPRQLSGGQQQRVALARALAIAPKVLLLDEPFSALDKGLRASMQTELKDIQRSLGVTTIFVTHDQSEALSLSDRIAVLSEGRIRQIGTPAEIYVHPADRFVAGFVGNVNVLRGRLERLDGQNARVSLGATTLTVSAMRLGALAPGATVELFVRPEQLRLAEAIESTMCQGVVAAQAYQGTHIDFHVKTDAAISGRVLVRQAQVDAMSRWPIGSCVGIALTSKDAIAFPVESRPLT
jgi:putative spermidine/putrescine transport system ATP-binding protein